VPPTGVSLPEAPFRKPARSTPPFGALLEDDTCPRVPNQRTFSGCRASAPRVLELKPRPYPVDFPTTLRVLSERDTCPRVPPADKTLRKPPELATRSECLNSKLPREPSESPRVPRLTTGESRIPPASPECAARSACDSFPRMPPVSPRTTPGRPSRTLGECAACRSSREQPFCLL